MTFKIYGFRNVVGWSLVGWLVVWIWLLSLLVGWLVVYLVGWLFGFGFGWLVVWLDLVGWTWMVVMCQMHFPVLH